MTTQHANENGNAPAHPAPCGTQTGRNAMGWAEGLTKREAFAMAALTGLRAQSHEQCPTDSAGIAQIAVADADALLAELAKEPT